MNADFFSSAERSILVQVCQLVQLERAQLFAELGAIEPRVEPVLFQ